MNTAKTKQLPLRPRVEVIIKNNKDEFLMIYGSDPEKTPDWRAFPGGGVDGMTLEEACITECLEEVGVRIKNVRCLGVRMLEDHVSAKGDRRSQYSGSSTTWFVADFDCFDDSKLGADNDVRKYEWLSFTKARAALQKSDGPRVYSQIVSLTMAATPIDKTF